MTFIIRYAILEKGIKRIVLQRKGVSYVRAGKTTDGD